MNSLNLTGLVAATYTPLDSKGDVNTPVVRPMVDHLLESGVGGLYVCGSTGEGISLTSDERKSVAHTFVEAVEGRVPVIVQVGHNSLAEARQLAEHAQQIGADAVSATCPSYFKVTEVVALTECMAEIASAAPDLPFYYYHIPALTGSTMDVMEFLRRGPASIPNLVGIKYTDTKLHEFQQCLEFNGGQFDVVWGCDEMLLGALATGARAAIGSTYNIAAPLYGQLIAALARGDLDKARICQSRSVAMIHTLKQFPFHAAMKSVLAMNGLDVGGCRLPQGYLTEADRVELKNRLQSIGFFDWSQPAHNET